MIEFSGRKNQHKPQVIKTIATDGTGVDVLVERTLTFLKAHNRDQHRGKEKIRAELMELAEREIHKRMMEQWNQDGALDDAVSLVMAHEKDPYSIVEELIAPLNDLIIR
jgi:LAO/AO transport system kinase